jgi:hypothetical protein
MTRARKQSLIEAIRDSERIAEDNERRAAQWKIEGDPWWKDCADVARHERSRVAKWRAELRATK